MPVIDTREFQLLHRTSADLGTAAVERGVFEVGGGYFKYTADILVAAQGGAGGQSFDLWDYGGPFTQFNPTVTQPLYQPYLLDSLVFLFGTRGPSPSINTSPIYDFYLYSGRQSDAISTTLYNSGGIGITGADNIIVPASGITPNLLPIVDGTVPSPHPHVVSLYVHANAAIPSSGYLRVILHGRFL